MIRSVNSLMMKAIAMAALSILMVGCTRPAEGPPPVFICAEGLCTGAEAQKLDEGKRRISELTNVSEEVDFSGVYLTNHGVCGKVTGIDGFRYAHPPLFFYATSEVAAVEPPSSSGGETRLEFIDALTFACST